MYNVLYIKHCTCSTHRQWEDGLLPQLLQKVREKGGGGSESEGGHRGHWVVLDGALSPFQLDTLLTHLDTDRLIKLSNSRGIPVESNFRFILEVLHARARAHTRTHTHTHTHTNTNTHTHTHTQTHTYTHTHAHTHNICILTHVYILQLSSLDSLTPRASACLPRLCLSPSTVTWWDPVSHWLLTQSAETASALEPLLQQLLPPCLQFLAPVLSGGQGEARQEGGGVSEDSVSSIGALQRLQLSPQPLQLHPIHLVNTCCRILEVSDAYTYIVYIHIYMYVHVHIPVHHDNTFAQSGSILYISFMYMYMVYTCMYFIHV